MFYGFDRQLYTRINPLAREYIFNKLEQRFQYNITEFLDTLDFDNSDIDTWSILCNQVSNGIISIIGHINSGDLNWLPDFCSTYKIPFLGLNDNYYYFKTNFSLSLMPDILPALITIIRRYQITQLVYIYDDINGAYRCNQLMKMQTLYTIQDLNIISRYLDNPDDSYDLLNIIELMTTNTPIRTLSTINSNQTSQGRYIVLDFYSFETYRIIMDKIKHRGMTTSNYHYILLTLNAKQLDMTYFRYGGVNVTFFVLPEYSDNQINKNYINLLKKDNLVSVESLLIADVWETLLRTINRMLNLSDDLKEKLKIFRQGKFLIPKIDCRKKFIQAWSTGKIYLESLINTKFQGLTGNIQFSNITGQRINYTFDVYRVTRNDMPKRIGFFRAPNILEVFNNYLSIKSNVCFFFLFIFRFLMIPLIVFKCHLIIERV
jgi:hypothetical protein